MKLFYSYNNYFLDMVSQFKSSFKDKWEIHEYEIPDFEHKNVMAGGNEGNLMRANLISSAFRETKRDEIFVVCDIDIIFYKPCIPLVLEKFKNKQKIFINDNLYEKNVDIFFQKENCHNGRINMGFMGIQNNERTKSFFEKVYQISIGQNAWDQPTIDNLLHENLQPEIKWKKSAPKDENNIAHYINNDNNLIWDTFPIEIWNWSIGLDFFSKNICLHHANCAVLKEHKNDQFKRVKKLIEENNDRSL